MNKETNIKLSILSMVSLLVLLIIVTSGTQTILFNNDKIQHPTEDILVSISNGNMSLPTSNLEDDEIHDILQKYNWDDWETTEQCALTNMMRRTAAGYIFDDEFISNISNMNRSEDIFNAYIDLMEHAGY